MHLSNSVTKATMIVLAASMLSATFLAIMIQPTEAQGLVVQDGGGVRLPAGVTPNVLVHTVAYLSFRPNPVGLGQPFLVNTWTTPALHASRYHTDYTVTIIKPDGTKDVVVMDSYLADATAWFEYTADQVGTWKLKFEFLGSYFPAGTYGAYRGEELPGAPLRGLEYTNFTQSCYYEPSSTSEQTLIVQEEMVGSWPQSPLPADYWTRPVHYAHREWWSILGDYPWNGPGGGPTWDELYPDTNTYWSGRYQFTPWVQAPNTGHIAWKQLGSLSGLNSVYEPVVEGGGTPDIIYAGRAYKTVTKPAVDKAGTQTYWQCYDIRTGEMYWERPLYAGESAPTVIEYDTRWSSVPGATGQAQIVVSLLSIGSRLLKYDPLSGALTANLTGMAGTYYMNGHVLSVQNLGSKVPADQRYRLINWTTLTTYPDFAYRVISNKTFAWSSLPATTDYNTGIAASVNAVSETAAVNAWVATTISAASLTTGKQLWNITVDINYFSGSCTVADHGKVAFCTIGGYWLCYDLNTGKQVWQSETTEYPWGIWWAYSVSSAYGMIYGVTYAGVYAIDWDTGKIVWHYKHTTPYPYETPYEGQYSFRYDVYVADGKVYTGNTEHTPTAPITRGWKFHCINATTGEGIWNITGSMEPGPMADGYITASSDDGYMYVFGKGKSQTTVTAPDNIIPKGEGIVIKGTVLDMSPAQPETACVSRESMDTWMDYLHMQGPINGIFGNTTIAGVPVILTALGSDGSSIDIGTVTTDGYYGTFSKTWTPPKEGEYKIIASFAGDDSYGSSGASTGISVGQAPAQISIPEQIAPPDYTMTIIGVGIAVIIAVAIVGVLILIAVRKR